jgi:Arm DNA-binding domain
MATKLTTIAVENAKPKRIAGVLVRNEIADRGCPGLYLLIQPSGLRSWAFRYRADGRSRKLTLGDADVTMPGALTLAAARAAAAQARHGVELGTDPAAEKKAARATAAQQTTQAARVSAESVEHAVEQFLALHARRRTRPASLRLTESILTRFILPAWRGRSIRDIKRKDVIAMVEGIAITTPTLANRALATLSKLFNWLVARDEIVSSPVKGVQKPGVELARDRVLDDAEQRDCRHALGRARRRQAHSDDPGRAH